MSEQVTPEFVSRPLNPPVRPVPAQPSQAQTTEAEPNPADAAAVPSGQTEPVPERGAADPPPRPGEAPRAETDASLADAHKSRWASAPAAGSTGGTEGDDADQRRRDDGYLADMASSVPLAAGEDGRDDMALAREIHSAVEPKDIFDRWRVEDLFQGTREIKRYRTQRVALPDAARFNAIVMLLMPYKNVFKLEAAKTAVIYLGREPEAREQARKFLRSYDITDAAINAQAAELHARSIAAMDRLIAQGQTRRSSIVREVERDKRRADKAKAKKSKPEQPDQRELALH